MGLLGLVARRAAQAGVLAGVSLPMAAYGVDAAGIEVFPESAGRAAAGSTSGLVRGVRLWWNFTPVVVDYRWLELKHRMASKSEEEKDLEWEALHERRAQDVARRLEEMRGFYVKFAQILAGRPDTVPRQYTDRLRALEDAVPARPLRDVLESVRSSMGLDDVGELFSEFDAEPLGSASIGQVHRAVLRGPRGGREVAVKVMDPDAEALFRADIANARLFCAVFAPEQLIVFDEVERQFLTEFDYRAEARNLDVARANMKPFAGLVRVPAPDHVHTTRGVLVMEYLAGKKLYDVVKEYGQVHARRQGKTWEELEAEAMRRFREEGPPPPYVGPAAWKVELYRRALKAYDGARNAVIAGINAATWPVRRPLGLPGMQRRHTDVPPNSAFIMDTLMKVMGHQVLVNGAFNADPHAGNFLMLDDGRIGLIDYGQFKRIDRAQRLRICHILGMLERGDKNGLMQLARKGGYRSKYFDPDVIWTMTRFGLDQDGPQVTGGKNIQQFQDEQFSKDPWSKTDASIIMPVRVSLMLRGVGLQLGHPVSTLDHWASIARQTLRDEGNPGVDTLLDNFTCD